MNTQRKRDKYFWIAIANVRSMVSNNFLEGAAGAHVVVFGVGANEGAFISSAKRLLAALELDVIDIDEVEHISEKKFRKRVTKEMFSVAMSLNDVTPVGYGSFFSYS